MYCPNKACGAVFEVQEVQGSAQPQPPDNGSQGGSKPAPFETTPARHQTGNVADFVQILPAEAAQPAAPQPPAAQEKVIPFAAAQDAASWREPPPVRRAPGTGADAPSAPARQEPLPAPSQPTQKKAELPRKAISSDTTKVVRPPSAPTVRPAPKPAPPTLTSTPSGPQEAPPGSWEPPPVRRGADAVESSALPVLEKVSPPGITDETLPASRKTSRILRWGIGFALAACFAAVTVVLVLMLGSDSEDKMRERAVQFFAEGKFLNAFETYDKLAKDFPNSDQRTAYEFLARLCEQLNAAKPLTPDLEKTLAVLKGLFDDKANEALAQERKAQVETACLVIAEDLVERASRDGNTDLLEQGGDAASLAERFNTSKENKAKIAGLRTRIMDVKEQVAHKQRVRIAKERLAGLVGDLDKFEQAWDEARRALQELRDDPEVLKMREKAQGQYTQKVVWKPKPDKPAVAQRADDSETSIIHVPSVGPSGAAFDAVSPVVFSLARGVLYAHSQSNGQELWRTRVGIDTTALPIRLPATEISKERVLVLSSETNTLTARDVRTGEAAWRYELESPCLGRPVVVRQSRTVGEMSGGRAFVPTYDGKVHVIDVVGGQLLGWYELGKALTVGGVEQRVTLGAENKPEEKRFLYLPADERYIFVLDIADSARGQPCVAVIPSGHPSGSLRSEPILISREEQRQIPPQRSAAEWPDFLVLFQADDLKSMKVRLFHVPPQVAPSSPSARSGASVPGWSWFRPHLDDEKFVQVTDAGVIDIRGIQQRDNRDPAVFAELPPEIPKGRSGPPGRAQVVHATEDDIWVLARGELRLRHFDRFRQRIVDVWQQPLRLGSPVHASQVNEVRKSAYVVTQDLDQPTYRISAVDASSDESRLHWQRQLGLLCQGDPIVLNNTVVVLDESGALVQFDAGRYPAGAKSEWPSSGASLAKPAGSGGRGRFLLTSRDGKSVLALAEEAGNQLVVRKHEPGQDVVERKVRTGLAGVPAVGEKSLAAAGTDGKLWLIPLSAGRAAPGPNWRSEFAERTAPGHISNLGGDDYLATNGFKGLARWHLPEGGGNFKKVSSWRWPEGDRERRQPSIPETAGLIVAPPILLPGAAEGDVQVIVVDARGEVTLLREATAANNRAWTELRTWKLQGQVTSGPFLRGSAVGFVVDRERLVWIDPAQEGVRWTYTRAGEGIVGEPRLVGGLLLVAHRTGLFVGIDSATGKPLAPGYKLKAQTAPAAAPVAFDAQRAFAPLTDGTVLLLSLKDLGAPQVAAAEPARP